MLTHRATIRPLDAISAGIAAAKGKAPRFMQLWGHNHSSIIAHINTAENELGNALVEFVSNSVK